MACNAANYKYFGDWQELTAEQQSFLIAHFYAGRLLESHQGDASYRYQKAESDKAKAKQAGRRRR